MTTLKWFLITVLAVLPLAPINAQTATTNYCPPLTAYMRKGYYDTKTHKEVSALQKFLKQNLSLTDSQFIVTGYFGALTEKFVKQFQQQNPPLIVTGQVGAVTRAKIAQVCNSSVPQSQSQTTTQTVDTTISSSLLATQTPTTTLPVTSADGSCSVTSQPGGAAIEQITSPMPY